jgi:PHD/YefM family antitoxin component YafN of YafNO toxin-antitoxin module
MKTITARQFFRDGVHKKHLAEGQPLLVTTDGEPDFYVIKAGPKRTKSLEEIERENAKIFGSRKRRKASFDSVRTLRELRE